eukprot:m.36396 g.36396  ORF g.36396 m.36396 type:complete len:458 (+) comp5386_c0_seq1:56-1429(+)
MSVRASEGYTLLPRDPPLADTPAPAPLSLSRRVLGLCIVAFLLNCLPSEAFLTKYLKRDKHMSDNELDNAVWPADTYSTFIFILPIGLLADAWGYRPVIALGMLFRELTRTILIFGDTLAAMVAMQVTYAASSCVDTIFFAYVYMSVPTANFQATTALVHGAYHLGNVFASALGQVLVSYSSVGDNLVVLFYLSWAFISLAIVAFLVLLPPQLQAPPPSLVSLLRTEGPRRVYEQARELYSSPTVLFLSLWWIAGMCTYSILVNYYQTQFSDIDPDGQFGTVEVVIEVGDAAAALVAGAAVVQAIARQRVISVFVLTSVAVGLLLYLSTRLQASVFYSYAFNILWMALYTFQQAVAAALIALHTKSRRYAILFTIDTLLALALASILQAIGTAMMLTTSGYFLVGAIVQAALVAALAVHGGLHRSVLGSTPPPCALEEPLLQQPCDWLAEGDPAVTA